MKTNSKNKLETLHKSKIENLKLHAIESHNTTQMIGGEDCDTWDANGMVHCDHITGGSAINKDLVVDDHKA